MKLTDKIIEFIDKTPTLADGTTRMITQLKLGRWICHARNLEKISEKSSDICSISGRYYVFTIHNGKLIQDSIALPEKKDAEHYVETMKEGRRGKDLEFIILSNAH